MRVGPRCVGLVVWTFVFCGASFAGREKTFLGFMSPKSTGTVSSASSVSIARSEAVGVVGKKSGEGARFGGKKAVVRVIASAGARISTASPESALPKRKAAIRKKIVALTPHERNIQDITQKMKLATQKERELEGLTDREKRVSKRKEIQGIFTEIAHLHRAGMALTKDPGEKSFHAGMVENFTLRSRGFDREQKGL